MFIHNGPNRFLTFYATATTLLLAFTLLAFKNARESFEEITVKRINVVDEQGHNRLVIANQQRMPLPIVGGKQYQRAVSPAGLVFYNEQGSECGGIALSRTGKAGLSALAFDYQNADAVGVLAQDDFAGGNFQAGFLVNDKDRSGKVGGNVTRIRLTTVNGNAGLVLNDPQGRPRIALSVDSTGKPLVKVLNAQGGTVQQLSDLK